jgi:hypothetical protein
MNTKIKERLKRRKLVDAYLDLKNYKLGFWHEGLKGKFEIYTKTYFNGDSKIVGYIDGKTLDLDSIQWIK